MEGEIDLILKELKKETEDALHDLAEVESDLVEMQEKILSSDFKREDLLVAVRTLRSKIGRLENIDSEEYNEEIAANNLMDRLRSMIDKCI